MTPWTALHPRAELQLRGARRVLPLADSDLVAVGTEGGRVFLRRLSDSSGPPALDAGRAVEQLASDGDRLTAWDELGGATTWHIGDPEHPRRTDAEVDRPEPPGDDLVDRLERDEDALCVATGPAGAVALGSAAGEVVLFAGPMRLAAPAHRTEVLDVAFGPSGAHLASTGTDGLVRVFTQTPTPGVPALDVGRSLLDEVPEEYRALVARLRHGASPELPGTASAIATQSSRGIVMLRACLQDTSARVRYRTLWLLGVDGIWGFVHELAEALHDDNESVRRTAVGTIDALDEVHCTGDLQDLLLRESDPSIRSLAEAVLARFTRPAPGE